MDINLKNINTLNHLFQMGNGLFRCFFFFLFLFIFTFSTLNRSPLQMYANENTINGERQRIDNWIVLYTSTQSILNIKSNHVDFISNLSLDISEHNL